MACDAACVGQGVLDVIWWFSSLVYLLILFTVVRRNVLTASFTALTMSLGVMDVAIGLVPRVGFVFPMRNWFR